MEERTIGLRPEITGKADRRIRAGPDAVKHECLPLGRLRQRCIIPDDADPASGTTGAAAANAGMRDVVAQARLEHAEALRHANRPAIAVGKSDHTAAALIRSASAPCQAATAEHGSNSAQ